MPSSSMATNVPAECPSCAAGGIHSSVKLYQINMEEAAVLCENPSCPFPLFSQDVYPLIVQRAAVATVTKSQTKLKSGSMDTESLTSSCSVSSWTSHASTISSISSNVATPPPAISSKPFSWPSNQQLVYQPKAVAPKQKNIFDWISPSSSSQSSPASSSVFSANDREVELVMKKSDYFPPNSGLTGLTPDPSPLLTDMLGTAASEPSDDTDAYIESFSFLLEDYATGSISPTLSTYPVQDAPYQLTELSNSVVESISASGPLMLPTSSDFQEDAILPNANSESTKPTTAAHQPKKRTFEIEAVSLDESPLKRKKSNEISMPVRENIELPLKTPVQVKKPRRPRVMTSRATVDVSSSDESVSSSVSEEAKKPVVSKPLVSLNVDADGTPVFTIQPINPLPSPKPSSIKKPSPIKKPTPSASRGRGRPKKTALTLVPDTIPKPSTKKKNKKQDPFCIQSLVDKFIQAAKNKKLPDTK